jgi:hypothetical protein
MYCLQYTARSTYYAGSIYSAVNVSATFVKNNLQIGISELSFSLVLD